MRLIEIDAPESRMNKKAKKDSERSREDNGRMLNEEIVKSGYANLMTIPPNVKYQEAFLRAYREARENKPGLWKD